MAMPLQPRRRITRQQRRGSWGWMAGGLGVIAFLVGSGTADTLSAAEGPVDDGSDHWAFVAPERAELPPVGASGSGHPIDRFLDANLHHVANIPEDVQLHASVSRCNPVMISNPNARSAKAFAKLAARIDGAEASPTDSSEAFSEKPARKSRGKG